jgi:hypothetical protein
VVTATSALSSVAPTSSLKLKISRCGLVAKAKLGG